METRLQNQVLGESESKAWARKVTSWVEQGQYQAAVDEHSRFLARGAPASSYATARPPSSVTPEELAQMSPVARQKYEQRWEKFKLRLVRISFADIQAIVKAHVLLGNFATAVEIFSRALREQIFPTQGALPREQPSLKPTQVIAYAREFILLLISQQTNLDETPYFVSLLSTIRSSLEAYSKEQKLGEKDFVGLFQRPIDAALASRDFGTAVRLFKELHRYPASIPVQSLATYASERVKDIAQLNEKDREYTIFEIKSTLLLASDHLAVIDLAIQHMPPPHDLRFQAMKAFLFPETLRDDSDADSFVDFMNLSELVWKHPDVEVKVDHVPNPKL